MPIDLEQRRQHAMRVQPWLYSTGAKTIEGKAKCSQNARKHGMRSRKNIEMMRNIRAIVSKNDDDIMEIKNWLETLIE